MLPTAPVETVNVYVVGELIMASGLPEIVNTPPIVSASGTKSKLTPLGRSAGGSTVAKVFTPTTTISIGVISAP